MATIIETNHGFIAGDPPEALPEGHHWCDYCGGDGLENTWTEEDDPDIGICSGCWGACTLECTEPECADHSGDESHKPHPADPLP